MLGEIELVEVLVHRVAQVVLDVQRDPAPSVAAEICGCEGHNAETDEQRQPRSQWRAVVQDDVVDDLTLDQRHDGLSGTAHQSAAKSDLEVAPVRHEIRPHPAHPAGAAFGS